LGVSVKVAGKRWKRWDFQGFSANLMPKDHGHLGNVGLTAIGQLIRMGRRNQQRDGVDYSSDGWIIGLDHDRV
jgi:hypothetical protein